MLDGRIRTRAQPACADPGMKTDTRSPDGFDATIHAENRLRICALLEAVEQIEFALVP